MAPEAQIPQKEELPPKKKRTRGWKIALVSVLCAVLAVGVGFAVWKFVGSSADLGNSSTGALSGTVVDITDGGTPISGATILLTDENGTVAEELTSGEDGSFEVSLASGNYTVTISADEYDTAEYTATVETGETVDVGEIALAEVASSQTVYLLSSITFVNDEETSLYAEYTYDEKGRSLTYTDYHSLMEDWYEYSYDDDRNTVTYREPIEQYYGGQVSFGYRDLDVDWVESVSDSDGNLLSFRYYDENGAYVSCDYTYNNSGNTLTYMEYSSDGTVYSYQEYSYTFDDVGNILTCTVYGADGEEGNRVEYTYEDGENTEKIITMPSGGYFRYKMTYTDEGEELTSRQYYSEDGMSEVLVQSEEYTYHSDGAEASYHYQSFYSDGDFDEEYEYTYDSSGNVLSYKVYSTDGSVSGTIEYTYTYGIEGNLLTETWLDSNDENDTIFEYTYDDNGNLATKTCYDEDGICYFWLEYTYEQVELTAEQAEGLEPVKQPTLDL